ncbi:hypothetical protein GMORB2_7048 [Geosmithia morbida]|uniref:Transmembrane protein 135 N-terminal domain-containing protein n=1 Tax=Geosmithia morbida TaxID=1094350 RepID=A0A9P4YW05_9HYPO|nr:uncharacterized protein GMORB2_7048 [Geosmithia morbida]KAF4122741.1 hypothetical protein GMORB2_7048 [Geosmithia morbida]
MSSSTAAPTSSDGSSSSAAPTAGGRAGAPPIDPILRNTLRYTVSAGEYAALHKYIISRSRGLRKAAPSPASVDKALRPEKPKGGGARGGPAGQDDFNARAVRHALRVFAVTWLGMKGFDAVSKRLKSSESPSKKPAKTRFHKSSAFRLSLSLSTILLLYRLLFRFLTRLRAHLLESQVEPFRRRNPRTTAALTSAYTPAVGASLAGLALGVFPSQQMRVSLAIMTMFRALEFGWNMCEADGVIWGSVSGRKRERPWWFGSWMLQPLAFGQLFHASVLDRDCVPKTLSDLFLGMSSGYLQPRPADWPVKLKWPGAGQIVDNIAEMARLNWPSAFISPTLFPKKENVLPPTLTSLSPLTSRAHPLISPLSCATLHPSDPSCLRTYLTFWISSFPSFARLLLIAYSALTLTPQLRDLYHRPLTMLRRMVSRALRTSTFATGALSTAWASVCFFQTWLPRHVLATQRLFMGGFLAGLWAWVERRHGRGIFLYTARASVDSLWKVGVKRRWWKAMRGGDVWVFVLALMVTGVVYERDATAIREAQWRKGMSWVRGEGWRDWAAEDDDDDDEEHVKEE